ncbi:hypothetical protein OIE43_28515 [Streptomyces pseudovenezuelae]|uniref:Uncharacterized protein n=1 Tax=Streptomyces pseudovenezuelae TaxID=67350 RepID=A0A101ND39_9ACTN|nr:MULTISPECIES: hypothetical protein [Streptomyces]KUM90779.1 hypothetical protein AQI94_03015 [Streptomyces pseudovenezuelae]WUA91137.1 hypothetical protein OHO81_29255 [Streptomyces pseudovenezuelae]
MGEGDPHIHVEVKVVRSQAAVRTVLAATFGLAGDLPSTVATGCGLRVPYAMTSPRPDRVTCLACREHARAEHLRLADEIERIGGLPGSPVAAAEARQAAARHRALAERFSSGAGG